MRLTRFVKRMISIRQIRESLAHQAGSDALGLFLGGLAAYLNDTHGAPKTDSELRVLLHEQRICMLVLLHAVQDKNARKFLTLGLIEWLSRPPTGEIVLRSGEFEIRAPPIPQTGDEN